MTTYVWCLHENIARVKSSGVNAEDGDAAHPVAAHQRVVNRRRTAKPAHSASVCFYVCVCVSYRRALGHWLRLYCDMYVHLLRAARARVRVCI